MKLKIIVFVFIVSFFMFSCFSKSKSGSNLASNEDELSFKINGVEVEGFKNLNQNQRNAIVGEYGYYDLKFNKEYSSVCGIEEKGLKEQKIVNNQIKIKFWDDSKKEECIKYLESKKNQSIEIEFVVGYCAGGMATDGTIVACVGWSNVLVANQMSIGEKYSDVSMKLVKQDGIKNILDNKIEELLYYGNDGTFVIREHVKCCIEGSKSYENLKTEKLYHGLTTMKSCYKGDCDPAIDIKDVAAIKKIFEVEKYPATSTDCKSLNDNLSRVILNYKNEKGENESCTIEIW